MTANESPEPRKRRLENAEQKVALVNEQILLDWTAPPHRQVQTTCEDVALLAKFIADYLEVELKALRPAMERDKAFVDAFQKIEKAVDEVAGCLIAIGETGPSAPLIEKVTDKAAHLREAFDEAVAAFIAIVNELADQGLPQTVRARAMQLAGDMTSRLYGRQLLHEAAQVAAQVVDEARQARDETERVRDETKKAAGVVGATSYGSAYSAYADKETHIADRLRSAVVGLITMIAGCAAMFAVVFDEASVRNQLIRLSMTLPLAVLAGYMARESSKHRTNARQARDLAIALHTVDTYTEPLDEVGRELRRVLGLRAFGAPADQSAPQADDSLYADLGALLERIETTVRRIRETSTDAQK